MTRGKAAIIPNAPTLHPHALPLSLQERVLLSLYSGHPDTALRPCLPRFISQHPGSDPGFAPSTSSSYMLMHPVYSKEYLESVHPRHKVPQTVSRQPLRAPLLPP